MSGRSGARPIPPATMTTSRPVISLDRPAAAERPAQAERRRRARARSAPGSPGRPPGSSGRGRRGRKRETEIGAAEKAGRAAITNWPGSPGEQPPVGRPQVEGHGVRGLAGRCRRRGRSRSRRARARSAPGAGSPRPARAASGRARRDGRELWHRDGSDAGDDRELLADVDADRAPGDAPAAADAAARPELVPPGRELVGQPLAVAVLAVRPERAAGDLGEAVGEARVPGPLGGRGRAVEVGPLDDARAEAGRADERAVGARRGSVRRRPPSPDARGRAARPARTFDMSSRRAHRRAGAGDDARRRRRRADGSASGRSSESIERRPGRRADPDDEPVVELGQGDVEAGGHLGPGPHRGAEAGRGRGRALDGDDERRRRAGRDSRRRSPGRRAGRGPGSRAPRSRRPGRR